MCQQSCLTCFWVDDYSTPGNRDEPPVIEWECHHPKKEWGDDEYELTPEEVAHGCPMHQRVVDAYCCEERVKSTNSLYHQDGLKR